MKKTLAILAAAGIGLAACSNGNTAASQAPAETANPDVPTVTVSMYPFAWLVEEIAGDTVNVMDLTPPGTSEHGIELSPSQIADIEASGTLIYIAGLSASIDEAAEQANIAHVINAGDSANLLTPEELGDNAEHEHHHEGEDADHEDEDHDHEGEAEDEHDHGEFDPHFWTDPDRMAAIVPTVVDALVDVTPDNESDLRAEGDRVAAELEALSEKFHEGLGDQVCETTSFVTTHEAFGYLANENGLHQVGIAGLDPEIEPSPARVREIVDIMKENGATTIFATSPGEMKAAQVVADEAGATVELLDPAGSQLDPNMDYLDVMEHNYEVLRSAMGCE